MASTLRPSLMALLLAIATPAEATAQEASRPVLPAAPRDFLFGRPGAEVGVRVGRTFARAGSDWYEFVTDQLTAGRHDFDGVAVGADAGIWLSPSAAVVASADVTHGSMSSEYRRLVDNNRQPITQSTRLTSLAATAGLKYALAGRGRAIGQLAWIPRRLVPYVTAGGGVVFYRLEQVGDFVDFEDSAVFAATFDSKGWGPTLYVGAGVDVRVARRMSVTTDVRLRRASARLNNTWVDFDPLDLGGVRVSVGTTWQF